MIFYVKDVDFNIICIFKDLSGKTYAARGISLMGIVTENLLSHPFLVLRRQCQV